MDNIDLLVDRIRQVNLERRSENPDAKRTLTDLSKALQHAIEDPHDALQRIRFIPLHHFCLYVAMKIGILKTLVASEDKVTSYDLATTTRYNEELIVRIMRLLTALGICVEVGSRTYRSNALAVLIANNAGLQGSFTYLNEVLLPVMAHIDDYLADMLQSDNDDFLYDNDPVKAHFGIKIWDVFRDSKKLRTAFDDSMRVDHAEQSLAWFDLYASDRLTSYCTSQSHIHDVHVVDVAGGKGIDMLAFKHSHPDFQGRLIVQDLVETLTGFGEQLRCGGVEPMVHDMFQPQPIKGARFYYLHHICHNWSDRDSCKILSNLSEAMSPSSRLLIHDIVLANTGEVLQRAEMDILMMVLFAGVERDMCHWERLIGKVQPPLRIVKVWGNGKCVQSVIELERTIES